MSKHTPKSLSDFIPLTKQPTFGSLDATNLSDFNSSSLMRITEPILNSSTNSKKAQVSFTNTQGVSLSSSRRVQTNNSKRMKLKDYLHLNSIEKKSKKSNSSSKIQSQPSLDLGSKKNGLFQSGFEPIKSSILQISSTTQPNAQKRYLDSNEILKIDITKRIEDQIKQLKDLSQYIQNDFENHEKQSQTQLILMNMLNAVLNGSKNYNEIGEKIIKYQQNKDRYRYQNRNKNYFWNNRSKQLDSPAKIMNKGIQAIAHLILGKK